MDVRRANELFELAKGLAAQATELRHALEREFVSDQLVEVFTTDYELGEVVRVEQVTGGYLNQSFAVWADGGTGERTYFVRKYNRAITEREVRFEHALVSHINRNGFHMAAQVFPTRTGGTFVTREEILDGEPLTRFFAVYEMLGGEDKYTWVKNRCTDRELESAARVLAQFHHCAHGFDPRGCGRMQPPIIEMLRDLPSTFTNCTGLTTGTRCDEYFVAKLPAILDVIDKGTAIEPKLGGMPFIPVHCDYHPGNQKWVDEQVTGLFDFDWSKLDYRVFDLGLALAYFCSSWEGADSGMLWLDKTNGNLYVLNWDVTAYYADKAACDDDEYLMYLEHQVKVMEYIEGHLDELAAAVGAAAPRADSSAAAAAPTAAPSRGKSEGPV